MAKLIKENFIAVSGNNLSLQYDGSESSVWFTRMAARIFKLLKLEEYFEKYKTYQGLYVAGPDGIPYNMASEWDVDKLMDTLVSALAEYKKKPPSKVTISQASIKNAEPKGPASSTSVVQIYYRCRPTPQDVHPINQMAGRDHLWIFPDDVRQVLKAADKVGHAAPLPHKLVMRLVRFHLLDNVRGLADAFEAKEVRRANFFVRLLRSSGNLRTFGLTGTFLSEKDYPGDDNYKGKLGVEGEIHGEFDVDQAAKKITRFRAYGDCKAWGANSNTWHQPSGKFPLVIAMIETNDRISKIVPPVWMGLGQY